MLLWCRWWYFALVVVAFSFKCYIWDLCWTLGLLFLLAPPYVLVCACCKQFYIFSLFCNFCGLFMVCDGVFLLCFAAQQCRGPYTCWIRLVWHLIALYCSSSFVLRLYWMWYILSFFFGFFWSLVSSWVAAGLSNVTFEAWQYYSHSNVTFGRMPCSDSLYGHGVPYYPSNRLQGKLNSFCCIASSLLLTVWCCSIVMSDSIPAAVPAY